MQCFFFAPFCSPFLWPTVKLYMLKLYQMPVSQVHAQALRPAVIITF